MIVLVDPHIPGYRVERLIGSGGMASVYLAIQESLERPVALKVLDDPESAEYQERFLNEGRIIASLTHSNIVTVHDIGVANRHLYISMEYVEGGDLRKRIREGISAAEAFEIVEKIGNALRLAHDRGVIHRDVKPANILFRTDGTPLLADFGIAKDYQRNSDLTLDGSLVGSPYYLSPEQARAHPIDGRADIYSMGVILYEMLSGMKPFKGESAVDTVFKHLNDPVPTLPEELVRLQWVIDKMLAKEPEDRFADAGEMIEAVHQVKARGFDDLADRIVQGTATVRIPAQPPDEGLRRALARRATTYGAIAAVVMALAIGSWLYVRSSGTAGGTSSDVLALSVDGPRTSGTPVAATAPAGAPRGRGGGNTGAIESRGSSADIDVAAHTGAPKASARIAPPVKKVNLDGREVEAVTRSDADASPSKASGAGEVKRDAAPASKSSTKSTSKPVSEPKPKSKSTPKPKPKTTSASRSKQASKSGTAATQPKRTETSRTTTRPTIVAKATPAPARRNSRDVEIERLLRLGRQRLDEGKLSQPSRDSALHYRDEVLALDPDNYHARRLGDEIVDGYVALAEKNLARGEYFDAKRHIDRGLEIDPSNDRLRWLKANALKQSARGFLNVFQRSLTTTEPNVQQSGPGPDK